MNECDSIPFSCIVALMLRGLKRQGGNWEGIAEEITEMKELGFLSDGYQTIYDFIRPRGKPTDLLLSLLYGKFMDRMKASKLKIAFQHSKLSTRIRFEHFKMVFMKYPYKMLKFLIHGNVLLINRYMFMSKYEYHYTDCLEKEVTITEFDLQYGLEYHHRMLTTIFTHTLMFSIPNDLDIDIENIKDEIKYILDVLKRGKLGPSVIEFLTESRKGFVYCRTIKNKNGRVVSAWYVDCDRVQDLPKHIIFSPSSITKNGKVLVWFFVDPNKFNEKAMFCESCYRFHMPPSSSYTCKVCPKCWAGSVSAKAFPSTYTCCDGYCSNNYRCVNGGVLFRGYIGKTHVVSNIVKKICESQNSPGPDQMNGDDQQIVKFLNRCHKCGNHIDHNGGCTSITCGCGHTFCACCEGPTNFKNNYCPCGKTPSGYAEVDPSLDVWKNAYLFPNKTSNRLTTVEHLSCAKNLENRFKCISKMLWIFHLTVHYAENLMFRNFNNEECMRKMLPSLATTLLTSCSYNLTVKDILRRHSEPERISDEMIIALAILRCVKNNNSYVFGFESFVDYRHFNIFGITSDNVDTSVLEFVLPVAETSGFSSSVKTLYNFNAEGLLEPTSESVMENPGPFDEMIVPDSFLEKFGFSANS